MGSKTKRTIGEPRKDMKLRLIGDLHGDPISINQVIQSLHKYDLTIQVGDFGIGFGAENYLKDKVTKDQLRILFGNHDNYQLLSTLEYNLGRFGVFEFNDKKIFFVGGAWSIDQEYRTPGLNWWDDEQLSYKEASNCLDLWESVCKEISLVITHDCPYTVSHALLKETPHSTFTGILLREMEKIHQVPKWRFGHYHQRFQKNIGKTNYRCLSINEEEILNL